jgi:hypothetical protein
VGELILPEEDPDVLLVALVLEILEEGEDPDVPPLPSVEQLAPVPRLELVPGLGRIGTEAAGELEQELPAALVARLGPGIDRPLGKAQLGIADDQRLVVLQHGPEAVAVGAGAAGIVEGEERGRHHRGRRVAGRAGG